MEKRKTVFHSLLLIVPTLLILISGGCGDKITLDPKNDNSKFDFGLAVFQVTRNYMSQTPPEQTKKVDALDSHKEPLITSINTIIPKEISKDITAPLSILLPLVDDGTLPQTTDDLKELFRLILNHPQDPTKETLTSIANLANGKGLSIQDWITLIGRLLEYPEAEKFLQAFSQIIKENDGVDDQGNPNGEKDLVGDVLSFLSRKLKDMKPAPAGAITSGTGSSPSSPLNLTDELLSTVPVRGAMGSPSYSVKPDANGNPAVAVNPATGTLYYPFIDKNGDGIADTDAYGRPIDQNGTVIDITPFGKTGSRNGQGLAVAVSGGPVYSYYDVKQTLLGVLMQMVGVAIEKKMPGHGISLLKSLLGQPQNKDNKTPSDPTDDYNVYSADNGLHDLLYGGLELFKDGSSPKLLDSLRDLTANNQKTTEELLISVGKAVDILKNTNVTLSKADLYKLVEDMVPLLEDVFKKTSATSPSTARLLFQTINDIGQAARNLPAQLAVLIRHKQLSPNVSVDFSQSAGTNNRSSLQQLLALLDAMDQCSLGSQTLTYITLDMMAGMTPQSVKNLVTGLDGLLALMAPLINLMCPGFQDNRKALGDLAMSGALDAFLPITKVFKDKGELRLLINILRRLYASYPTLLRKAEPTLADILESGAVENLFDILSITTKLQVPNSTEKMADVMADSFLALLDSSKVVYYRNGTRAPRLFDLLYQPFKTMEDQISKAGKTQELTDLTTALLNYIAERVKNDNGTPADPSDDFEELKYPNLIPLLMKVTAKLNQYLGTSATNRLQNIQTYQSDLATFMGGRDFYSLVDLVKALENSTAKDSIYKALENLFTPQTTAGKDVFGSLASVVASLLQTKMDSRSLNQLEWFVGEALDPQKKYVKHIVNALNRLIEEDQGKMVLTMLRSTFNPDPNGIHEEPLTEIYRTMQDVYKASQGGPTTPLQWKKEDIESLIQSMLNFIEDKRFGIDMLYNQIKNRKRRR